MSQVNDSQPSHPVIVFRVNLRDYSQISAPPPNSITLQGNETVTEAENQKNARSTFIPGLLGGENMVLKHGDTFTLKGNKAVYMKKLYVSSPTALHTDLLQIVSES